MPAGDWAQAGRISSQRFNNAMEAVAINSVDPNKLIQASMKSRSAQRKTAMKAKEALYSTQNNIEAAEARQDAEKSIEQSQMNVRKAGMLAAGALTITASQIKPPHREMPDLRQDLGPMEELVKKMEDRHTKRVADAEQELSTTRANIDAAKNIPGLLQDPSQPGAVDGKPGLQSSVVKPPANTSESSVVSSMGFSGQEFDTYKKTLAGIESGGKYDIAGGSNKHYDGKYQLGADAKTDASRVLGIADPGHTPEARTAFRKNPQMQEQMLEGFTKANHNHLMRIPAYANADNKRKLELLGYAHNQGMGNAEDFLRTGQTGYDGFNTPGTLYIDSIRSAFGG